jgi:hypothetical protein
MNCGALRLPVFLIHTIVQNLPLACRLGECILSSSLESLSCWLVCCDDPARSADIHRGRDPILLTTVTASHALQLASALEYSTR